VVCLLIGSTAKTLHFLAEPVHLDAAWAEPSAIDGTLIQEIVHTVSAPESLRSCTEAEIRTIAKYAKPPYNEIVVNVPPAMLGPVAQESVADSALLRSNFSPFKTAFLYTSCTQIFLAKK
jgi:hypothetical protein